MENGLESRTEFSVLKKLSDGTTLLEARPLTGRTNQIRIHFAHLGFPVCGDPAYLADGKFGEMQTLPPDAAPLCLHSWKISFAHPQTKEPMTFTAPPPSWAGGF
jgi:23S rRNA-/tRNA-specific pseudouridylate synthase